MCCEDPIREPTTLLTELHSNFLFCFSFLRRQAYVSRAGRKSSHPQASISKVLGSQPGAHTQFCVVQETEPRDT